MSKSKVFWTDEEKQQLIEALALEMTANHRELRLNLVNEVQKVLPPTRRRNIISLSVVPDLIKSVKDLVHKLQEPEVVERVVEVEKIVEVACVKMCSTTELLAELFNRIDQRITRLEQAIGKVGLEPRIVWEHPEIPQPPEAPKKPKVLVVGLKYTHQHKFIEDRLGHALGFRWLGDEMLNKKALPDVDMCYFWASHGSHSQQEVLQSIYGKDKVVLCKGGVQTIVDNIAKDFHIIM